MSKQYINNIKELIESLDSVEVKEAIGDSTNNNRVPSVNQIIRYLVAAQSPKKRQIGKQLAVAYEVTRSDIRFNRIRRCSFRTDAFDINEFKNHLIGV